MYDEMSGGGNIGVRAGKGEFGAGTEEGLKKGARGGSSELGVVNIFMGVTNYR